MLHTWIVTPVKLRKGLSTVYSFKLYNLYWIQSTNSIFIKYPKKLLKGYTYYLQELTNQHLQNLNWLKSIRIGLEKKKSLHKTFILITFYVKNSGESKSCPFPSVEKLQLWLWTELKEPIFQSSFHLASFCWASTKYLALC